MAFSKSARVRAYIDELRNRGINEIKTNQIVQDLNLSAKCIGRILADFEDCRQIGDHHYQRVGKWFIEQREQNLI